MEPTAYPLAWPAGWPRTVLRQPAKFRTTLDTGRGWRETKPLGLPAARDRLSVELDRIGARLPVLSTNLELRLDGQPRAGRPEPADPGIAVYFRLRTNPLVLACDRWDTVAGNIAAVAAHLDAMRGMDRWGVGSLDRMFTGFTAIRGPSWRDLLGNPSSLAQAEAAFRAAARTAHPDAGGSHDRMATLNAAIAAARKELAP